MHFKPKCTLPTLTSHVIFLLKFLRHSSELYISEIVYSYEACELNMNKLIDAKEACIYFIRIFLSVVIHI